MVKDRLRTLNRANFARNRARAYMARNSRAFGRMRPAHGPLATRKGILSNPLSKEKFNYANTTSFKLIVTFTRLPNTYVNPVTLVRPM